MISIAAATALIMSCSSPTSKTEQESNIKKDSVIATLQPAPENTFDTSFSYKRYKFKITATGDSTGSTVTLIPSGYISNQPITEKIGGIVTGLITGDIDGDDFPEITIISTSQPSAKGEAIMYSSDRERSIGRVNISSPLSDTIFSVYKGHDEFLFVGKNFVRRFPVYIDDQPTNKLRHLQFKLVQGKASKQLVLGKVIDL